MSGAAGVGTPRCTATIAAADRAEILRRAAASAAEVCGLLLGVAAPGTVAITHLLPAANVAADPARFFEIDPAVLLAAHRAARAGAPQVVGHYHSHPGGDATPSPRDAAAAAPDGALWLIAAAGTVAAWRAVADGALHGRFDAVELACHESGASPQGAHPA